MHSSLSSAHLTGLRVASPAGFDLHCRFSVYILLSLALFQDETGKVEDQPRGNLGSHPAQIVRRRHLDKVEPDYLPFLGERFQQLVRLVVGEASGGGRSRTGGEGRIYAIDIDRDEVPLRIRHLLHYAPDANSPDLPRRHYYATVSPGRVEIFFLATAYAADAKLGHAFHVVHLRQTPHRASVTVPLAGTMIGPVEMGVDLDGSERSQILQRSANRYGRGVIAAHNDRHRATGHDLSYGSFDVLETLREVSVHHVDIAAIDDAPRRRQVHLVEFGVVRAAEPETVEGRTVAYTP